MSRKNDRMKKFPNVQFRKAGHSLVAEDLDREGLAVTSKKGVITLVDGWFIVAFELDGNLVSTTRLPNLTSAKEAVRKFFREQGL